MNNHFSFNYEVGLLGLEITTLSVFIPICIFLFITGVLSEFLSFFQYCMSEVVDEETFLETKKYQSVNDSVELGSISSTDSSDNLIGKIGSQVEEPRLVNHDAHFDLIKYHPFDYDSKLVFQIEQFKASRIPFVLKCFYKINQLLAGYAIMIIMMSFNFWFLLSIVLGYTFGYYLFFSNWKYNFVLVSKLLVLCEKIFA